MSVFPGGHTPGAGSYWSTKYGNEIAPGRFVTQGDVEVPRVQELAHDLVDGAVESGEVEARRRDLGDGVERLLQPLGRPQVGHVAHHAPEAHGPGPRVSRTRLMEAATCRTEPSFLTDAPSPRGGRCRPCGRRRLNASKSSPAVSRPRVGPIVEPDQSPRAARPRIRQSAAFTKVKFPCRSTS